MSSSPTKNKDDGDAEPAIQSDSLQRPKELEPHSVSPPFHVVADLLNLIAESGRAGTKRSSRQSHDRKREILSKFFESWRMRVGLDLFPLVRMLVPERDRQRPNYGLKEQALAKGYVAALGLAPSTSAAKKLLLWKAPDSNEKGAGDFSQIAYDVISERTVRTKGRLTVDEVNQKLDELARASGDGKNKVLSSFANSLSAQEQKWLIRIILKDLKISIRERIVLSVLHPDATDLFNVCSDLQRVCYTLYSKDVRLPREDSMVGLFKAFRPMLCKRNERDLGHIVKLMTEPGGPEGKSHTDFVIEEKLDGERMQLHKRGSEYRYWSRKDKDYTYLYGKTPKEGSLTPWIHSAFHESIEEIILDGEMLVWDPEVQKTQAFGNLKTAALNPTNDPMKCRPVFRVFDILYVKGRGKKAHSFVHKPLSARKEAMHKFFREEKTRLEYAWETKGKTAEDIKTTLQRIVEERGEGLVIKRNDSHYVLNGREDTWIKVKPDYMDELGETFDLVVVGAYWGQGNRGGRYASFMCALRDNDKDPEDPEARYLTFCKVGSGFTYSALKEIMEIYGPKFTPWDRKNPSKKPGWLVIGRTSPELPDCWIHPHDSFVVTVKAAEIAGGDGYGVGKCTRFPRCTKIPDDRTYANAFTLEDFYKLQNGIGKGDKRVGDKLSGHKDKKRKPNTRKKAAILASFKGADVSDTAVVGKIFDKYTFYVLEGFEGGDEDESKHALEKVIYEQGGDYAQTIPKKEPRRIIGTRTDYRQAKKIIQSGNDLIHPSWVMDSIARGRVLPLRKRYLVHATPETQRSSDFDASDDDDKSVKKSQSPPMEVDDDGYGSVTEDEDDAMNLDARRKSLAKQREREPSPSQQALVDEGWVPAEALRDSSEGRTNSKYQGSPSASEAEASETESEGEGPEPVVIEAGPGPARFDKLGIQSPPTSSPTGIGHDAAGPGMGADTDAMDYDDDKIFKPLVFYLDTVENAERNGLSTQKTAKLPQKTAARVDQMYEKARKLLTENGGKVVSNLTDPSLTHILVADDDPSRSVALMRKTRNETRLRQLVNPDWVFDSVASGAVAPEGPYRPTY